MHVLEVLANFLMMTWALSLVPIMAMSIRILFTSHDRCWSVGSLLYLLRHLATCASASISGPKVSKGRGRRIASEEEVRHQEDEEEGERTRSKNQCAHVRFINQQKHDNNSPSQPGDTEQERIRTSCSQQRQPEAFGVQRADQSAAG